MRRYAATIWAIALTCTLAPALADAPPAVVLAPLAPVECQGPDGGVALLDASGSSDPDGAPLSFAWSGPPQVRFEDATAARTRAFAPLGLHDVTLRVSDASSSAHAVVGLEVRDTEPPRSVLRVEGVALAPGVYHRSAIVHVEATDACDPRPCGIVRLDGVAGGCQRHGLYQPGRWSVQRTARDASGNEAPVVDQGHLLVVHELRLSATLERMSPAVTTLRVMATFDGREPAGGAKVSGLVTRDAPPGTVSMLHRFPFEGSTDQDGILRVHLPPAARLPGDYTAQMRAEAYGLPASHWMTFRVDLL